MISKIKYLLNKINQLILNFIIKIQIKYEIYKLKKQQKKIYVNKELLMELLSEYIRLAAFTLENNPYETQQLELFNKLYTLNMVDTLSKEKNVITPITKNELIKLFGHEDILYDYIKIKILNTLLKIK